MNLFNENSGISLLECVLALLLTQLLVFSMLPVYREAIRVHRFVTAQTAQEADILWLSRYFLHVVHRVKGSFCGSRGNRPYIRVFSPEAVGVPAVLNTDVLSLWGCFWVRGAWQWERRFYYLGRTRRRNSLGRPILALFEFLGARSRSRELLDGLRDLHFFQNKNSSSGHRPDMKKNAYGFIQLVTVLGCHGFFVGRACDRSLVLLAAP